MKPIRTFRIWLWLPLAIFGLYTGSIVLSAVFQHQLINRTLKNNAHDAVTRTLANAGYRIESLLRLQQGDLVADEVAEAGEDLHVNGFALLDDQGRVLEATRREWRGLQASGHFPYFEPARFALVQKSRQQLIYFSDDGNRLQGYQPLTLPPAEGEVRSSRIGALVISYDLTSERQNIWRELLHQRFWVWSVTLGLMLLLMLVLRQRLLRPLRMLTNEVRRFDAGMAGVEAHITGRGELADLARAWNSMRAQLAATMTQLEESRENLEVTLYSIGDAVIATDTRGHVTRLNDIAQQLTGWTQDEAAGLPLEQVFNIVQAHTRRPASNPVLRVLETGMIVGLANHTVLIARDGREFQIADSAAPIRSHDGQVIGVVLVFRDVTEEYALRDQLEQSELRLRAIVETQPECVKVLGADGALLQMNRAGLDMIEADSFEQVAGKAVLNIVAAPYRQAFADLSKRVFEGESGVLEFEIDGLKGGHRWLETHAVPLRDAQGKITALLGLTRDITAKKIADRELRIAASAFETQEGIMVTDAHNVILRVNKAFSRITGYSDAEIIGKTPDIFKSGRHDPEFFQRMWEGLARDRYWQGEIWNRRKSGEVFPEWLTITAVHDEHDEITNYVAAFSDITQYKEAEEKIHQLAFYDPLTGLPNRRLLYDRLQQALAAGARTNCYGAILFIDLDNFKVINDTRGHDVGDLLLIEVARRLHGCVRVEDTVARLGGDEFVIMLDSLSDVQEQAVQQVEVVGQKVLQTFAQVFNLGGRMHYATPSIGISLFHDHEMTVDELLKRSDAAMYQAKQSGRNALRFYDPSMQAALEARLALEADMRRALPENEFALYYQSQVDATGKLIGAEVLLRWQHPVRGLISPGFFIPLAEETGLIGPLGQYVLEKACHQLKLWEGDPRTSHLQLAVNVSARQFRQGTFVDEVGHALIMSGVNPSKLKLELTESLVLENVDETISKMQKLKVIGVRFSMDDFGTGQSSLTYLKKLPLDQLKIDQSFVRDITKDPDDAIIVKTIIAMAKNLRLDVIAEGVETEEQRLFLEQCGCPAYQGYLFGRPVPIDAFEAALKT